MKYIIFENKYPIIFPEDIIHCTIKMSCFTPTSAGHFDGKKTYGESESLGLKPKDGDLEFIKALTVIMEENK